MLETLVDPQSLASCYPELEFVSDVEHLRHLLARRKHLSGAPPAFS